MLGFIRTLALSTLVGFGALASAAAPAAAQSGGIHLGFGAGNGGPQVGLHVSDRGRHDYRDRGRHQPPRFSNERRGHCSPREAVYRASRMGLRDARVVSANHRVIRVEGKRFSQRYHTITFANARDCPVLR